jgi:hypothetical protein
MLYRIQAADGRGPFRPGFSEQWRDTHGPSLPPIYDELGIHPLALHQMIPAGFHAGCACRSMDELRAWFSRREMRRLERHCYGIVTFDADRTLAETATQVLFCMRRPLTTLGESA